MLSVIIATNQSERVLVPTLAALVPGATAGLISEVILADAGSDDGTTRIADIAGCQLLLAPGPVGTRLHTAAAAARAPWLLFLQPGMVPDATWIEEARRFVQDAELGQFANTRAAVFRPAQAPGPSRSTIMEALLLIASAVGGRMQPDQGLLIAKRHYDAFGGHSKTANAETVILRRLGRRRLVMLRSGVVNIAK